MFQFIEYCKELWPKFVNSNTLNSSIYSIEFQKIQDKLNISIARQILWHALNNIESIPTCRSCNIQLQFNMSNKKYNNYCSLACEKSDPNRKQFISEIRTKMKSTSLALYGVTDSSKTPAAMEKKKQTMIERYGVEHALQSSKFRNKFKQTSIDRYGVDHAMKLVEFQQKASDSVLLKYGVKHPAQSPEVMKTISNTCMERYGEKTVLSVKSIQEKIKMTMLAKYGILNSQQSQEFRNKMKSTMISRYGVEHALQNSELLAKSKNTCMDRYGVDNIAKLPEVTEMRKATNLVKYAREFSHQQHISLDVLTLINNQELFASFITNKTIDEVASQLALSISTVYKYVYKYELFDLVKNPDFTHYEQIIKQILDNYQLKYETHNRSILNGKELDFYLPQHNLAIEVGSIYWHSELHGRSRDYHQEKWSSCRQQGITLLQYFDNEICTGLNLIESKIARLAGISVPVIGARKCTLSTISAADERNLLQQFHLQGPNFNRNWRLGAYYQDQPIAVISLKHKQNSAELVRWCTDVNYSFPGLFSRMLRRFILDTEFSGKIHTFSNNCYGNGKLYQSSGFVFDSVTSPGYFYTKAGSLESRVKYQKHKLSRIFNISEESVQNSTEWDIMKSQGYDRFWDAGHTKWIL